MIERERLSAGQWIPPWLAFQHTARYDWVSELCRSALVLDAACGNGYGSKIIYRGGASRVLSVDVALEALGEDDRGARSDLTMLAADVTALPLRSHVFNVVVSFETIEHVQDDRAYLREMKRVLATGGTYICSTPNRKLVNPGNSLSDRPFNRFHIREYAPLELKGLLESFFDSVEMIGQTPFSGIYARLLSTVGSIWPTAGTRLHQLRKVFGIPLERQERHLPHPMRAGLEPEVLVAICR